MLSVVSVGVASKIIYTSGLIRSYDTYSKWLLCEVINGYQGLLVLLSLAWSDPWIGLRTCSTRGPTQGSGIARPGTTIMVRPVLILLWLSRIKVDTR